MGPQAVRHRRLKVMTDDSYPVEFNIDLGQENVSITRRRLTTHARKPKYRDLNIHALTLERAIGFDLLHTFNAVPIRSWKPFVVTFESALPRVWGRHEARNRQWFKRLTDRLLSRRCRALLAMSQFALREFRQQHEGQSYLDDLLTKTRLVYPSVIEQPNLDVPLTDELRVIFVGHDYMRKGLPVVTRAHQQLRAAGVPIQTTVVSKLRWVPNEYGGPDEDYDFDSERRLLDQPGLVHHETLPNKQVMTMVATSHFSLLPTMHDTFGYSVIETLSRATPVIATATCALPELIDDNRSGVLLPFANEDRFGHWSALSSRKSQEYHEQFRETVEATAGALADALTRIWRRRREYPTMRQEAIEQCRRKFDRLAHCRLVQDIQHGAMTSKTTRPAQATPPKPGRTDTEA